MSSHVPALETRLKIGSVVDQVTERLEAAIISGELEGGRRISEHALASSLGISRGPLREALNRLEGRRLIERVPHVGARVVQLRQKDLEEILTIRESLESLACKIAATTITDADLDEIRALSATKREDKEGIYHNSSDHDFHSKIMRASRNEKLIEILERDIYYLMRIHRYRSGSAPGRSEQAAKEHQAIIEALEARDPEAAGAAMERHLRNAHANLRGLIE